MDVRTSTYESATVSVDTNKLETNIESATSNFGMFINDSAIFDETEILAIERKHSHESPGTSSFEHKSVMDDNFTLNEFVSFECRDLEENNTNQVDDYESLMNDSTIFDESEIMSIEICDVEASRSSSDSGFESLLNDSTIFDESVIMSVEADEVEQRRGAAALQNEMFMNESTVIDEEEFLEIERNYLEANQQNRSQSQKLGSFQDDQHLLGGSEVVKENQGYYELLMQDEIKFNEYDIQFMEKEGRLNQGQKELYMYLSNHILKEHRKEKCSPLKLFVTGSAGTGKSFVLKLIVEKIQRTLGPFSVRVCAFTGAAAILVNGQTIHSTFKLNVLDSRRPEKELFKPLNESDFEKWQNVSFLIIDEISMVSYELLSAINTRLQELKHNQSFFGEVNLLLFGDLFQLPPITGNPIFKQPEQFKRNNHLFRLFQVCELTEIERQKGKNEFIDLLNNLRVNGLSEEQYALLENKFKNQNLDEKMLRIVPLKRMAEKHNNMVSRKTRKPKMKLEAIDNLIEIHGKGNLKLSLKSVTPEDCSLTYGVLKELTIFEGQRVMLRVNLSLRLGLVNGSLGEIVTIQMIKDSTLPRVLVDFDKVGLHWIGPTDVEFEAKYNYGTIRRTMIPLIPAYAITVHKLQGCTVERAAIDLGSHYFQPGQKFVALSRVSSLEGIEVLNISRDRLVEGNIVDKRCLVEMERLRKLPKFCMK